MTKKPTKREGSLDIRRYESILGDIANVIDGARRSAARSVNCIATAAYWPIVGRRHRETEQRRKVQRGKTARNWRWCCLRRSQQTVWARVCVDNLQRFRAFTSFILRK